MPRRAPDKVVEHRMSLSTQSSKLLRDSLEQQKKAALFKGVASIGQSFGTIAVAGGVGLAAYAFFSWSGAILPKITDKVKDLSSDLGNYVIKNTEAGQNLESMLERLYRQNKEKNERTQEQVDNLDLIINDPNSSANQVSAATAEKARIIAKAKKRNQAFQKALRDQNLIP
jgi:hypothetical protein